jgi:hypothetical protein
MEPVSFSEAWVSIYQIAWRHIRQGRNINIESCSLQDKQKEGDMFSWPIVEETCCEATGGQAAPCS